MITVRSHTRRSPQRKPDPLLGTVKPRRNWKPGKEWPRAREMSRSGIIEMMHGIAEFMKRVKERVM